MAWGTEGGYLARGQFVLVVLTSLTGMSGESTDFKLNNPNVQPTSPPPLRHGLSHHGGHVTRDIKLDQNYLYKVTRSNLPRSRDTRPVISTLSEVLVSNLHSTAQNTRLNFPSATSGSSLYSPASTGPSNLSSGSSLYPPAATGPSNLSSGSSLYPPASTSPSNLSPVYTRSRDTIPPRSNHPLYNNRARRSQYTNRQSESKTMFDTRVSRNMTVAVGQTAELKCRVFNQANKTVSWLRQESMHILSAGLYTYISNNRFLARYDEDEDTWILEIRDIQMKDGGVYECQVSSLPVISFFVNLDVLDRTIGSTFSKTGTKRNTDLLNDSDIILKVPKAEILGDTDLYVQSGSSLNITCVINHLPHDQYIIRWVHQDRVLSYNSPDKAISVFTAKGEVSTSTLIVQDLAVKDSGRYVCAPGDIQPSSINVHVLQGEVTSQLHIEDGSSLVIPLLSLAITASVLILLASVRTIINFKNRGQTPVDVTE